MIAWVRWLLSLPDAYSRLQDKQIALQDQYSALQDEYLALQDRHEALLDSHTEALTELLEWKQMGAQIVADGTATVARLKGEAEASEARGSSPVSGSS